MDFEHTDERKMLVETLDRWVRQDYPLAARLDAGASEIGFSREKWEALAELGIMAALFDEQAGGFGGSGFDLMVVFQALGRGLVVEPILQSAVLAGGALVAAGGPHDQISRVISGDLRGALASSEPHSGYDAHVISSKAEPAENAWRLWAQKSVVRHAEGADFLVIPAKTSKGISLFRVDPTAKGVALRTYPTIDGASASEVVIKGALLPPDALIGTEGQGGDALREALGRGVLCLAAEALGLMETMRDMTLEYLRTRKQFGLPLGKFQVLQHRMAEMLIDIEQVESAVINAAALLNTPGIAREKALSAAKVTIGRTGRKIAEETIQMHGGIGMTWEYPLGHFAKRLVMIDHELGDEDFHLARYIRLGATK